MHGRLPRRDIVLIGAGHTNLHVVRMWASQPLPETRLTLISPFSRATYSGMLPGTLAGLYQPEDMEIDLYRLALASNSRLLVDAVTGIDVINRRVLFEMRPPVRFDVASIGVGSVPAGIDRWRAHPNVLAIKPMATFRTRLESQLLSLQQRLNGREIRVVVVGGGAAGLEISLCLDAWFAERGIERAITLLDSGSQMLRGYLPKTVRLALDELQRRRIICVNDASVQDINEDSVVDTQQRYFAADLVIWATGAAPSDLIQNIPLPKVEDGFLAVRSTLQTTCDAPIFAVGDCATLVDQSVPKAGVYAVREGPILWRNIQRLARGEPLESYRAQTRFLSLLADGRGAAFFDFKGFATHSRWAWRLKDHIDRKFMRMHQELHAMPQSSVESTSGRTEMRCLGCGGKAGANVLRMAFARLQATFPQLGPQQAFAEPSDAALLIGQSRADLVSVDFFHAFLDDPWLVGRIAALNALSDIWAMGGRATGALAMLSLPEGEPMSQAELLFQTLAGALHEFGQHGVELLGGHTLEADSLMIGFTVLGTLEGREPTVKSKLQLGDQLVLTKPIGTGAILAALRTGRAKATWMDSMLASMLRPNCGAAEVAQRHGVRAMTDITGFGLAGHLLEMLQASQMTADIRLQDVPFLPGCLELLQAGTQSTLAPANSELARAHCEVMSPHASDPRFAALFDPQTSGGLLIGVTAAESSGLLKDLAEQGCHARCIGEVSTDVEVGSDQRQIRVTL